jgi:tetratricopeptide (TPR) repeat protein
MNRLENNPRWSSLATAHVVAAAVGGAAIVLSAVAGGVWHWNAAPAPVVWRDVALVYLLFLLPLVGSLYVAATAWSSQVLPVLLLEIVAMVVVPRLYVYARCESDAARVSGLVEQSRFGEAQELLGRLLVLNPQGAWQGVELKVAAERLQIIVNEIETRAALPLAAEPSDEARLVRARDLAMLGRADEALTVLDASPALRTSPVAANLRGTIHETRHQWQTARTWYGRAEAGWRAQSPSPGQNAELIRALTGIAYSERKSGRLREAEAAYQKLLALSPTPESHFLVAQFYEDTQQANLAQSHALQAMALDPPRYERRGRQLVDKLVTSHFGCLTAFTRPSQVSSESASLTVKSSPQGSVP